MTYAEKQEVQRYLISKGHNLGTSGADGIFGTLTNGALSKEGYLGKERQYLEQVVRSKGIFDTVTSLFSWATPTATGQSTSGRSANVQYIRSKGKSISSACEQGWGICTDEYIAKWAEALRTGNSVFFVNGTKYNLDGWAV